MFNDESPKYSPDDIEVLICMCFHFLLVSIYYINIYSGVWSPTTHTCISWYNEKHTHTHTTPSQTHSVPTMGPFPEEHRLFKIVLHTEPIKFTAVFIGNLYTHLSKLPYLLHKIGVVPSPYTRLSPSFGIDYILNSNLIIIIVMLIAGKDN